MRWRACLTVQPTSKTSRGCSDKPSASRTRWALCRAAGTARALGSAWCAHPPFPAPPHPIPVVWVHSLCSGDVGGAIKNSTSGLSRPCREVRLAIGNARLWTWPLCLRNSVHGASWSYCNLTVEIGKSNGYVHCNSFGSVVAKVLCETWHGVWMGGWCWMESVWPP